MNPILVRDLRLIAKALGYVLLGVVAAIAVVAIAPFALLFILTESLWGR